ncbi:MAG: bifunctional glutamate N-acetyltransferase/amino-acid acetyltransferase ArgJ [Desulfomonile tiedjei]|nr:bifunctional glutamate N-acetyltransferase/amino-acid acetyltransferase ArgJ [Desulfomonile tiedjei]
MNEEKLAIRGFRFSAVAAGVKQPGTTRLDLGLIVSDVPATAAGVTTTNLVAAAPVQITRKRLERGLCQAILINSGNANAYTGEAGMQAASDLTREVAQSLALDPDLVLPMSTGVIGNPLPVDRMRDRIPDLIAGLDAGAASEVARAMMTTDTRPKTVFLEGTLSTGPFKMLGIAKGSGMIAPDMATMLAVILTDVRVERSVLQESLVAAVERTFNRITIDGDTSTNDTLVVLAGGEPSAAALSGSDSDTTAFAALLNEACSDLARQLVLDGEGATKLVEIHVRGAVDEASAVKVAKTIAESPLVKTAFHGGDPNWGRIIAAAGRAGVPFNPEIIELSIGHALVVKDGSLVPGDWEPAAARVMKGREFSIFLDLKSGPAEACFLTTDFSAEYVAINADYRS